ncbi:hypothetical protein BVX98_06380 [bacterium F11]|nr:hypothetical protein BVX98_06380 [bacterium F11]
MSLTIRLTTILSLLLFFLPSAGRALKDDNKSHVKATILAEVRSIQAGYPFWVGIKFEMDEGWHTYWKNPGDSGGPIRIQWELPTGFEAGPLQWPYPKKIETPPLVTYGYENETMLLAKISPAQNIPKSDLYQIKAHVRWIECAEACKPGSSSLLLSLKKGGGTPQIHKDHSSLISTYKAKIPLSTSDWSFAATDRGDYISLMLSQDSHNKNSIGTFDFFPNKPGIYQLHNHRSIGIGKNRSKLVIDKVEGSTIPYENLEGILVSDIGWRGPGSEKALQINIPIHKGPGVWSASFLWIALLFAFIGGILLNFMPCVLPVISIKILALTRKGRSSSHENHRHGLLYGAGIMGTFWALLGILLLLRAGGEHVGWGFQLQSPIFVALMASFFFLFGLNLFGVFEIGTGLLRAEEILKSKRKNISEDMTSFFSGILATIVATPCTAPFMGTALGFALVQPIAIAFLVFTFLALGMAIPYYALTLYPAFLNRLPKPGPWMTTLKQVMAFLMWATVAWLLWVLSLQIGSEPLVPILVAFLVLLLSVWIWGKYARPLYSSFLRYGAMIVSFLLGLFGFYWIISTIQGSNPIGAPSLISSQQRDHQIQWKPYQPNEVEKSIDQNHPVFINFTAAWCLTCKVNEKIVFSNEKVISKFREMKIDAFKADWTNKNDIITKALQKYGRSGVPVYVIYDPNDPLNPRLLPEVLTPRIVLDALEAITVKYSS